MWSEKTVLSIVKGPMGEQQGNKISRIPCKTDPETEEKAKRANNMVFLRLIRDQKVRGSNPRAPGE